MSQKSQKMTKNEPQEPNIGQKPAKRAKKWSKMSQKSQTLAKNEPKEPKNDQK